MPQDINCACVTVCVTQLSLTGSATIFATKFDFFCEQLAGRRLGWDEEVRNNAAVSVLKGHTATVCR